MNKWPKIKSKIYEERLNKVSGIFDKISKSVNDVKTPRNEWVEPLAEWTIHQISENNVLKLSLQEYAHFKKVVNSFDDTLAVRNGEKGKVVDEFRNTFINDYTQALNSKENEVKLEVVAQAVEEKQFPLEFFAEWYAKNWTLSPEKFNEELGNFWGDVWNHAAKGAGYGALGGGAVGSFAGAGLGGLAGGLAGGLYGGGKNLLQRVWNYRQTQNNFEQTRDKALESLKKLRELSRGFDMHPNFLSSLDSMINQLGTVRAYRVAPNGVSTHATDQEAVPGKPVNPMNQAQTAPPANVTPPTVSAPQTAPETPPVQPEIPKPKRTLTPEQLAGLERGRMKIADNRRKAAEAKRQDLLNTSIGGPSPEITRPETPKPTGINNEKDIVNTFDKAITDKDHKTLIKLGNALIYLGKGDFNHTTGKMELENLDKPINFDHFNQAFQGDYGEDKEAQKHEMELAALFVQHIKQQKLAEPGKPKEIEGVEKPFEKVPNQEQVLADLENHENMKTYVAMTPDEFLNFTKEKGLDKFLPKFEKGDKAGQLKIGKEYSENRIRAINALRQALGGAAYEGPPAKTESALTKYKRIIHEKKLASLPVDKKASYLVSMITS